MRRKKKSSGRNLLSRTSASKLANFPCIVWLSMHLWHWKPLGQESNSKIHNRKIQRNCSFLLDFISLLERIFLLHDVSQQLSFEHEEFSSRDTSLYSYYWIVPSLLTYYAVGKVFGFLLLSKPTECLNSTFRDSKRRLLVYFEDFDHPTETQMLHTPLLLGALAIFVYRIMSSQCSKASKATEFPFESYGCDAKLSGGAEEIASSSDFSFLRFFGVKLYDVIKRGGVGLQMRFTTFQCTTYTPN